MLLICAAESEISTHHRIDNLFLRKLTEEGVHFAGGVDRHNMIAGKRDLRDFFVGMLWAASVKSF